MTSQQMVELMKKQGVRPTSQRLAVFEYLLQHRTHPSAETVYEALVQQYPTFSRTTVYNSLHALAKAGLILELSIDTDERRYDADTRLHGHFHCLRCGSIADFPVEDETVQCLIPVGYLVQSQDIYFSGLCPSCQSETAG